MASVVATELDPRIVEIQGWMSERDLQYLHNLVCEAPSDALIVELGTWKGRSTAALYTAMHGNQTVVTVDTWLGQPNLRFKAHREVLEKDLFLEFLENMEIFGFCPFWYTTGKIGPCYLRMDSVDAASLFEASSVYILFVDCDHRKVGLDIDAFQKKVKPDGIFCGHDYNWVGVKESVKERFPISHIMDDLWIREL